VKMKLVLTPQTLADVESANVIADIKGSEHPEQTVIVSGHLDSWDLGTGAIDDAAGVALSMEAANLVQKLHLRPKHTIRVIAWMTRLHIAPMTRCKVFDKNNELKVPRLSLCLILEGGKGRGRCAARKEMKGVCF